MTGLRARWQLRDRLAAIPVLQALSTAVIELLCDVAEEFEVSAGSGFEVEPGHWYLLTEGEAKLEGATLGPADEGGEVPFLGQSWQYLKTDEGCRLARIRVDEVHRLTAESPQLGYRLRRYRQNTQPNNRCDWLL